ncbi:hypothetical protein PVAP13_5KG309821 [Panicum virgatum]|uniref:Uncharacterized protein n=1 Tax=Panicum virgatum TaxID=38727 RepID=A0A8T0SNW1_PANVG|nr:hypothetical protein PVAP13_5KG309821 [Panicum virgatum]
MSAREGLEWRKGTRKCHVGGGELYGDSRNPQGFVAAAEQGGERGSREPSNFGFGTGTNRRNQDEKKTGALGRLAGALGGQARRSRPGRGTGRARAAWRRGTASRALGGRWRPPAWRGRRAGLERRGAAGSRRLDAGRRGGGGGLRLGAGGGGRSRQVGSGR